MNQRAGFGPLQARERPKGRAQKQSSSGREALNPYREFSLFPPPLEEEGWCKFVSCIHFWFLCWKPPPCFTYTLCYHFQWTILPTFKYFSQPHSHLTNSHSQPTRLRAGWQSDETVSHKNFLLLVQPDILQQQTLSQYFGTSIPCSGQDPGMQVKKILFKF